MPGIAFSDACARVRGLCRPLHDEGTKRSVGLPESLALSPEKIPPEVAIIKNRPLNLSTPGHFPFSPT
jgi:hypothetical protein